MDYWRFTVDYWRLRSTHCLLWYLSTETTRRTPAITSLLPVCGKQEKNLYLPHPYWCIYCSQSQYKLKREFYLAVNIENSYAAAYISANIHTTYSTHRLLPLIQQKCSGVLEWTCRGV